MYIYIYRERERGKKGADEARLQAAAEEQLA